MIVQIDLINQINNMFDLIDKNCSEAFVDNIYKSNKGFNSLKLVRQNIEILQNLLEETEKIEFLDIIQEPQTTLQNNEFKYLRVKLFPSLLEITASLSKIVNWALESENEQIRQFSVNLSIRMMVNTARSFLKNQVK